LNQREKQ
jgi:hypothetical protein